jgi:hypothetical protein
MTMKTQAIRRAIKVRLFAVALLATCAFAASANAQSFYGKFTLPSDTHWGKNVLPAGNYTMSLNSQTNVALIRSADGNTVGFTPIPIEASSKKGATALMVMVRGNERIVRSLNLPALGVSLIYTPATSAEREILAKADQVQSVPVITAGK